MAIILTFEQGVQDAPKEVQKYRRQFDLSLHKAKADTRAITEECLRDMEKGLAEGLGDRAFIEGKIAYYRGILSAI